jgi:hypothetical protein
LRPLGTKEFPPSGWTRGIHQMFQMCLAISVPDRRFISPIQTDNCNYAKGPGAERLLKQYILIIASSAAVQYRFDDRLSARSTKNKSHYNAIYHPPTNTYIQYRTKRREQYNQPPHSCKR